MLATATRSLREWPTVVWVSILTCCMLACDKRTVDVSKSTVLEYSQMEGPVGSVVFGVFDNDKVEFLVHSSGSSSQSELVIRIDVNHQNGTIGSWSGTVSKDELSRTIQYVVNNVNHPKVLDIESVQTSRVWYVSARCPTRQVHGLILEKHAMTNQAWIAVERNMRKFATNAVELLGTTNQFPGSIEFWKRGRE